MPLNVAICAAAPLILTGLALLLVAVAHALAVAHPVDRLRGAVYRATVDAIGHWKTRPIKMATRRIFA